MKRHKFFEISIALNCFFYVSYITDTICFNISSYESDTDGFLFFMIFLLLLLVLIVAPFTFSCYILNKAHKQHLQLSKRADTFGIVFGIFYSLFSLLQIFGCIKIINDYFKYDEGRNYRLTVLYLITICFTITSVYLSIGYWKIRKRVVSRLATVVSELGSDVKS
jgi:hypothetical protein